MARFAISVCSCLVVAAVAGLPRLSVAGEPAVAASPPPRAQDDPKAYARKVIDREFRINENLQAAWLLDWSDVPQLDNTLRYDLIFAVDSGRAEQLQAEVTKFLKTVPFGSEYRIVAFEKIPLSQLIADVNYVMDAKLKARSSCDGCLVQGASIQQRENQSTPGIYLYGRVDRSEQTDTIAEYAGKLQKDDPAWGRQQKYGVSWAVYAEEESFTVTPLSPVRGAMFFGEGVGLYWQGQYKKAEEAFRRATLEAPDLVNYRYWLALALLKQGQEEDAYQCLITAYRRAGAPPRDYRRVLVSLERVQGATRMDLYRLEMRALDRFHQPSRRYAVR